MTTKRTDFPELVPLAEAAPLVGRPSVEALATWISRWNRRNPAMLVRKGWGVVHLGDLRRAVEHDLARRTPGIAVARALESQAAARSARSGGARA